MDRKKNKIPKLHIRKGDTVKVLSGDNKGQQGRVLEIVVEKRKAFVEGINLVSKHTKQTQKNTTGGIVKKEAAVHISNLMVVDGKGNATRTGRRLEKGKLVRFSRKTNEIIKTTK